MAHFIAAHYSELPRFTYFMQDDGYKERFRMEPLWSIDSDEAFEVWAAQAEERPLSSKQTCLCTPVTENTWTLERYGRPMYLPMRWFMDTFLDFDVAAANWTTVRWPGNAQLLVPRAAIRGRSHTLYVLMAQLLNGTTTKEAAEPEPANLVFQSPIFLPAHALTQVAMEPWAHIFERLWFAIFDRRYSPYQADYDARQSASSAQLSRAL